MTKDAKLIALAALVSSMQRVAERCSETGFVTSVVTAFRRKDYEFVEELLHGWLEANCDARREDAVYVYIDWFYSSVKTYREHYG